MIWQVSNTVKILRDKAYEKTAATEFTLKLFRNETEGVQFVLTPERGVKDYKISVSELRNGEEILPSGAVKIYAAKYIQITKPSADTLSETGFYPDALLPFEKAVEYGENKIAAGANQSVWLTVRTETDTKAGEYTGEVTVWLDGKKSVIPLKVRVWDFALPTENHTKQLFIISNKEMERGEGEKSLPLIKRYYDKALEYRINGNNLPYNHREENEEKRLAEYLKTLKAYHFDPRCSVFNIPHAVNGACDDVHYERVEKLFDGVAEMSFADRENYFRKFVAYIWILDEPHLSAERMALCKKVLPKFEAFKNRLCEKYAARENTPFAKTLAETVKNIPVLITCGADSELLPSTPDEYRITYCPAFGYWSQDENIRIVRRLNGGEKWWYGCDWPAPPSPTYHIDDDLLSARVLSWMQFENGITGNLYWRFNYCRKRIDGVEYPPDPYGYACPNRNANGDGFLAYPGRPYGLDNFVPSIRLEAIRDGIEDYEALYSLQKIWETNGEKYGFKTMRVSEAFKPVFSRLYENSRMLKTPLIPFEKARETLAECLIAAEKYAFTLLSANEREIKFFTTAEDVSSDGEIFRNGDSVYTLRSQKETAEIKFCGKAGEIEVSLYVFEIAHPVNYNVAFNWLKTAQKYGLENCDPKDLLQPYYQILNGEDYDKLKQCICDLNGLKIFTWRTEAVIRKRAAGEKTAVFFTLPQGELTSETPFEKRQPDEKGAEYAFLTSESVLNVTVKNEKGVFTANLYLR